jgi:hypothetical protein
MTSELTITNERIDDFPLRLQPGQAAGLRCRRLPAPATGATDYPGLYFFGLPWLTRQKSGLFLGVGEDAAAIAQSIDARRS